MHRAEQPLPLIKRGQAEGRRVGLEEAHRMRIEGRDQRRPSLGPGALDRTADNRLMSKVKPVEVSQRDDSAAQPGWNRRAAVQPLHGAGL